MDDAKERVYVSGCLLRKLWPGKRVEGARLTDYCAGDCPHCGFNREENFRRRMTIRFIGLKQGPDGLRRLDTQETMGGKKA